MIRATAALLAPAVFATYMPFCSPAIHPTRDTPPAPSEIAELWVDPGDLSAADLKNGPWGPRHAPDPNAIYTFVKEKVEGVSPGLTVKDPRGRTWSVKQGDEASVEVVLSHILSAVGYHQPPVYYLHAFRMKSPDGRAVLVEEAGRFRPHGEGLKDRGQWSFQQNPFVGTRPYQGLLVILVMFNSSDLKNSNNSLYELKSPREGATRWYVVRDLGTALGETGRLDPTRSDPALFARDPFIVGMKNGFVQFEYHGWHQELFRDRVTPDDVVWACRLLGRLSDRQWADAFSGAGYSPQVATQFIARLKAKIAEGQRLATTASPR